jgi:hypothetical protein
MTESTASSPVEDDGRPIRPHGYRLIMPPGWVCIPLRKGTAEALEDLIFTRLKELPPDVPKDEGMKYRLMIRRAVEEQVGKARAAGGLDLYLPVGPRYGTLLAASFLVTEVLVPDSDGHVRPDAVLAQLASGNGTTGLTTQTQELAGCSAVRREYVQSPAPERDVHLPSRHIEYALPVPQDPRRYIAVSFSTGGDGNPDSDFTTALADLFDAVMTTFRWMSGNDEGNSEENGEETADHERKSNSL